MRFGNFWIYRPILLSRRFALSLWRARRNIVADTCALPPFSGPYMAELDVTYLCDCRCQMCQRWKDGRREELTLEEYRGLAEAFHRMGVHLVSIAGGEPLLRKDIFSIVEAFAAHGMCVNVCTNGLLLEEFAERLLHSHAACVTVSIDGGTACTHDRIRGFPGAYQIIQRGIRSLLAHRADTRPLVRVRMTVCNQNVDEIGLYLRTWQGIADDVLLQPVHYCKDAFYTGAQDAFGIDPSKLERQVEETPMGKDGYMKGLMLSLARQGTFPENRCFAGILMARLDPWGNVFPCLEQHACVGSVRKQDFGTIWHSDAFNRVRRRAARENGCRCWYNNTALMGHYGTVLGQTTAQAIGRGLGKLWRSNLHALGSRSPAKDLDSQIR